MSLSLAKTWVEKTIGQPAARADALRLLNQAAVDGVDASLIVGPELSTDGKCYLARWDGLELVVLVLGQEQVDDWSINPKGLFQELHTEGIPMHDLTTEPLVALSISRIDKPAYDGWTPLTGICQFEIDGPQHRAIENSALRVHYFRPDLPRPVTAMWYAAFPLRAPGGELRFCFPPLFSKHNPHHLFGTLVVFLQMFAAENWVNKSGCRKISNVTAAVVTLQ